MIKKVLCMVLVIFVLFGYIIAPLDNDYNCYAVTGALSLQTYQMLAPYFLIAAGLVYTDVESFYNDSMALAEYMYQSALEQWGEWQGQVVTKGQMAKIYILDNYRVSPEEPPPNPKKPKYYIPTHIAIYEIVKAWVVSLYSAGDNKVITDVNVIPISELNGMQLSLPNNGSLFPLNEAYPYLFFYDSDGNVIMDGKTGYFGSSPIMLYGDIRSQMDYNTGDVINEPCVRYDGIWNLNHGGTSWIGKNPIEISYWSTTHYTFSYLYNPYDGFYPYYPFNVRTNYVHKGPVFDKKRYESAWIPNNKIAYFKLGYVWWHQNSVWWSEMDDGTVPNGQLMNPWLDYVNIYGIPGIVDDSDYFVDNADGILFVPVEPFFDPLGDLYLNPDGIPQTDISIGDILDITISDLENLDMDNVVDGNPDGFYPPDYNPEPEPYPEPDPQPYPEPDPEIESEGIVGEWILNIPILGDILRILIQIRDYAYNIYLSIYSLLEHLVNQLKHMLISLFVPDTEYFPSKFEPLIFTFETKFGYDLDFLNIVKNTPERRPENIEVDIMGVTATIVSFDYLDDILIIVRPWIQSFIYFMLLFYHVNNAYKLIRGTSLVKIGSYINNKE